MFVIVISNFLINILQIRVLYRIDTSLSLSIAFLTLYILSFVKEEGLNRILAVLFCIIIFFQTKSMNQAFYNDYVRYQKEASYGYYLANQIISECEDTKKPLVWIYKEHDGTHQNRMNEDNGWSLISWSSWAFNAPGTEMTKFINSLGYNFTTATAEQIKEAKSNINNFSLEVNNNKKIYETDKYIIVIVDYNV